MSGDKVTTRPPPVHSDEAARLAAMRAALPADFQPTDSFMRCMVKLNDPRLIVGPPLRHVERDACPTCGCETWPEWPTLSGPLDQSDPI